jgi:NADH-quinone oxidoreductase subunit M
MAPLKEKQRIGFTCANRRVTDYAYADDGLDGTSPLLARFFCFSCRAPARWIALATTATGFAIGLAAFFARGTDFAHLTTIIRVPWVSALGMNYHLAVDGISLTMALVTGLTAVCAVLFSWHIEDRSSEFFFWLLLVVGGSYGVFLSADLFLLFVFYELVIVPKYFLIAIWGSTNKEYGAMKLTLYSFFGGALVFIGILAAYVTAGTLDLPQLASFPFAPSLQSWAFPVLFLGFAVLGGVWPLHVRRQPVTSPRPPPVRCFSPAS